MGNNYLRIPYLWEKNERRAVAAGVKTAFDSSLVRRAEVLQEETFQNMLALERRRATRSGKPFVLMLLNSSSFIETAGAQSFMSRVVRVLSRCTRDTDLVGWHEDGVVLGVIFTEISAELKDSIGEILHSKVVNALRDELGAELKSNLAITAHVFPEDQGQPGSKSEADTRFYPDISNAGFKADLQKAMKRVMDIAGSGLFLLLASPLIAAIAIAIKLTSKGPVVFKQERLGQFGTRFKCLKFRSMYANNDPKVHQEYIKNFIAGQPAVPGNGSGKAAVFKLTNDPRVTSVGRFLRKTSLDELPQFWNVLCGEMSLVGPRPSLPYEFEAYNTWHRRRVLEVKPGITGLWQVSGRSRTTFDDMVRLDLRYFQSWSLWLDLRILLATPRAVLGGDGAY